MKRQRNPSPPPPENTYLFNRHFGFESDFIRMLLSYLPLDSVFAMRATLKRWKAIVDGHTRLWKGYAARIAPLQPPTMETVRFFSLQGIKDCHVNALLRLFCSENDGHQYLVRRIISTFLNEERGIPFVRRRPASASTHPGAQNDPFSFYLNITFAGPQTRTYQFFCVQGQTILWRVNIPNFQFSAIRNTKLVKNYRNGIQYLRD